MSLIYIWCIFACSVFQIVVGQEAPRITKEILPEVKRVGMTGYLNCTVARQTNNKVFWIHKATQTILTSDDRIEVDDTINQVVDGYPKYDIVKTEVDGQATYTLLVRRLVLTDAGNYTCQIVIKASGQNPYKDGLMVVLIPPTIFQAGTTQTVTVTEGGATNLSCTADGYPTPNISWVRVNGNPLPPPYNKFAHKGNVLQLTNIGRNDRGMYRCVADNNVRPLATYDSTVYVNFKPAARPIQSTYGQAQNRLFDLTIECIVAGYPAPDMQWYHEMNGGLVPVIDDDRHVINQLLSHGQVLSISEVWYQLTIINVQANDYGKYMCEGTNKLGTSSYTISVFETSECQGANCPPEGGFTASAAKWSIMTSILLTSVMSSVWLARL